MTVYYSHGISPPSITGGGAYISAKPGKRPTFSDWAGAAGGISGSLGYFSGNFGVSTSYSTFGIGLTYGRPFSFAKQQANSGTFNIGVTKFTGPAFYLDADFSKTYIRTQTYLGGQ